MNQQLQRNPQASESVSNQEFDRYKRFRDEQYKNLGIKVKQLEEALRLYNPSGVVAPKTKDLLARQVSLMFKKIQFIETNMIKIGKKVGIQIGPG